MLVIFIMMQLSCPQDCTKPWTLSLPQEDLFNWTSPLLWEASNQYVKSIRLQISTTVYSQVLIHTAEWTGPMYSKQTWPKFDMAAQLKFQL